LCVLTLNSQLYLGIFLMQIELGYQLFIHACSGNYLRNIFLLFFRFFCVKRPDGVSGCSDGKVASSGRPFSLSGQAYFVRSLTWHYIRTSLKFRPDCEPCRVISHSPALQPLSFHYFWCFCRLVRFSLLFMCASHVRLSFLQFISTPGTLVYLFTDLF
jgi:hypothetical protein